MNFGISYGNPAETINVVNFTVEEATKVAKALLDNSDVTVVTILKA